jgi:hypothetical protein
MVREAFPISADLESFESREPAGVMIRTRLAFPWFSLSSWVAVLIAAPLVARDSPVSQIIPVGLKAVPYWYPRIAGLELPDRSYPRHPNDIAINRIPGSTEAQPSMSPMITMLSIRAGIDQSGPAVGNTLGIQCRTYVPVSNARRRNVTIHGVVTQDVVSSAGKIVIMAGSRVVGRAAVDPENGRLKSTGLWSVFCDSTEIKIQARLLDRYAGMAGMLGQETNEDEALHREAVVRDGRYVFVPEKTSFTLEVYGDISLQDIKSKEASD